MVVTQKYIIGVSVLFAVICAMFIALVTCLLKDKCFKRKKLKDKEVGKENIENHPSSKTRKEFPEYSRKLLENTERRKNEFQLLVSQAPSKPCTEAQTPVNKEKNRYINILPFDETRVILPLMEGDPSSDYVNGNYIGGHSNSKEYIATQGPKEQTCYDFWRMVLAEHVPSVFMLSELVEKGSRKCFKYYPDDNEEMEFDDITIKCTSIEKTDIYEKRNLTVKKQSEERLINHYHVHHWGDFGCPDSTDVMIKLCEQIRRDASEGKILVHCSAGVGRTGTLISVDILTQCVRNNEKLNVFETVEKLREQRVNMVQTEEQYFYIYKCLVDYITEYTKRKS